MKTRFSDWRVILRHYSSLALSGIAAFSVVWASSPDLQSVLPAKWVVTVNTIIAVAGFIGKFLKQDLPLSTESTK